MNTFLPEEFLSWARKKFKEAEMYDVSARIERIDVAVRFRDEILPEIHEGERMKAYAELGEVMNRDEHTARQLVGMIREYSLQQLFTWVADGLSFHHIMTANRISDSPADLLKAAVVLGSQTGNRPMTVTEMVSHHMNGQDNKSQPTKNYWVDRGVRAFSTLLSGKGDDVVERFRKGLIKLINEVMEQ
jgi:hypothetical protein